MVDYTPKLHAMTVQRRDPIVSQKITWDFGPNFGDSAFMMVTRIGDTVTISGESSGKAQSYPIERARALYEALGNVLRWESYPIEYVRNGVCLLCGDGVLSSGEHIDPERHEAEVERITSGEPT